MFITRIAPSLIITFASFSSCWAIVLDDFDDGNHDGWTESGSLPGTMSFDSTSGRLNLAANQPVFRPNGDGIRLDETIGNDLYANGIFRATIEPASAGTDAGFWVGSTWEEGNVRPSWGYSLGFSEPLNAIAIVLRSAPTGFADVVSFAPMTINVGTPYVIEGMIDGSELSMRIWEEGEQPPSTPQLRIDNARVKEGGVFLGVSSGAEPSTPSAFFDNIEFEQLMPGDFDNNNTIDASDIDRLANELREQAPRRIFDMNSDGMVSLSDHEFLITTLGKFTPGDTNLDGTVDFPDFLALSAGFGSEGGWSDGDFDGNGTVEFPDFLILSANFGSAGQAIAPVPEPTSRPLCILAVLAAGIRRKRQRNCASVSSEVGQPARS